MAHLLLTPPTSEPLHLDELCEHLRTSSEGQWMTLARLLQAARHKVEGDSGQALVCQRWLATFPAFADALELRVGPLMVVDDVRYLDTDGAIQTLDAEIYTVDTYSDPATIRLAYGQSWPSIRQELHSVQVRYRAGYVTPCTFDPDGNYCTFSGRNPIEAEVLQFSNSGGALPEPLSLTTQYVADQPLGARCLVSDGTSAVDFTGTGTGLHFVGQLPLQFIQAMKLLAGHWYENRESTVDGRFPMQVLPHAYDDLIWSVKAVHIT